MVGRGDCGVIVNGAEPGMLNVISGTPGPGVAFAVNIACRRDPVPRSAVVVTGRTTETAAHSENSDVLLLASVAVAVTNWPAASDRLPWEKFTLPVPSVLTGKLAISV
jgi:hypothetical protein